MNALNVLKGMVLLIFVMAAQIAVAATAVEFYNPDLDNFFITADPGEQTFIDGGTVGNWQRTGNTFPTGGANTACRFYGSAIGPNSHFYTADAAECAYLKSIYNPAVKSWKFESNDFQISTASGGACPAGTFPIYRAYNKGPTRGVDSNHRITNNVAAIQEVVGRGWNNEGIVMCSPTIGVTTSTPTCPAPQVIQNGACAASCLSPSVAIKGYCVSPPPTTGTGYNYAALDGTYSCNLFSGTPYDLQTTFSAIQLIAGLMVGNTVIKTYTYADNVGFLSGYPYYSRNLPLSSNAETVFFLNGQLTVVTGPASDVPNLLLQRPTSRTSCSK